MHHARWHGSRQDAAVLPRHLWLGVQALQPWPTRPHLATLPLPPSSLPLPRSMKDDASVSSEELSEEAFEEAEGAQEGTLSRFHGHTHCKVPIIRLLRNNLLGLGSQILVRLGLGGTPQHCPAAAELQTCA